MWVGLSALSVVTFVVGVQRVFPYARLRDRMVSALSVDHEVTIERLARGWLPGRFTMHGVRVKTRAGAVVTFDRVDAHVGITTLLDDSEIDLELDAARGRLDACDGCAARPVLVGPVAGRLLIRNGVACMAELRATSRGGVAEDALRGTGLDCKATRSPVPAAPVAVAPRSSRAAMEAPELPDPIPLSAAVAPVEQVPAADAGAELPMLEPGPPPVAPVLEPEQPPRSPQLEF